MTYRVTEIFPTLQGEGRNAGRAAIFVRFAGCNIWSGHDEHRQRDADRNDAKCPLFCDTDFRVGEEMTQFQILDQIGTIALRMGWTRPGLIVFTGGEPTLQLDESLVTILDSQWPSIDLAIETNGTHPFKPGVEDELNHICVSPKTSADEIVIREGAELKVVFPEYDPDEYLGLAKGFDDWYVSPEAATESVGKSLLAMDVMKQAAQYCLTNPAWRLSLQTHKLLDLP